MVKCAECGFLGIWDLVRREWLYADETFRATGDDEMGKFSPMLYHTKCFALAAPLREEWARLAQAGTDNDAVVAVVNQERECDTWTKWNRGFTPKEHREMLDRQWQLDWQAQREDADREWRGQQSRWNRKARWVEIALTAIGVAIAVIGIVVAARFVITAANIQANAQLKATQMLIDAQKTPPPPTPSIEE